MLKIGNMHSLLPYIFNSAWFLDNNSVQGFLPLIKNIYKGEIPNLDYSAERIKHRAYVISSESGNSFGYEKTSPKKASKANSIAVIPIMGVITLHDQTCGPEGMLTKAQYLQDAGQNKSVDSVILCIDSPGGEAHAMFSLSNAIADFKKNYDKPIIAHVGAMAASAAYGIAACCDKIICSDTHSVVGSIGTYITVIDQKKSLEAEGIFINEIYAEDSTNKNIEWREAISGNEKPMKNMLKAYNDRFISIVKNGRPEAKKTDKGDPFTGATIFAADAIDMNLIDDIGNITVAIKHCMQSNSTNYSQTNNTMNIPFQKAWASIAAFFSDKNEGEPLTEAEVVKLNTELGNQKTTITDLTSQISEKNTEIANLTQQLTEAKTGSDALQSALTETEVKLTAANAVLAKRPGTSATTPEAEVEKIEIDQDVNLDEINQVAKQYR